MTRTVAILALLCLAAPAWADDNCPWPGWQQNTNGSITCPIVWGSMSTRANTPMHAEAEVTPGTLPPRSGPACVETNSVICK